MKNKHILLIISLFSLVTLSCVKQGDNEFKPDLPAPAITGFEKTYSAFTHRDTLNIKPTIENERQYDFFWTVVSTNFVVNSGVVPRGDTIARSKDLSYEILLNPGQYLLAFHVQNRQTKVTQITPSTLNISTLTMGGWYLLKDDGGKTDFDFVHADGRIDNWMANFNGGQSLNGKAVKSVFSESFKIGVTSTDLFNVFVVLSDEDAGIYRIDNGKKVMGFDNMFFTKPTVKKPQNVVQPTNTGIIHLINDGKVYMMSKGALFGNPPASNYKMSAVTGVLAMTIAFDENSKSVIFADGGNYQALGSNGNALKNMDANIVWVGGYAGFRNVGLVLFKNSAGDGQLVKLNGGYGFMAGFSSPLIMGTNNVPQSHGLMSADVIGGNYDSDYIYYAKGNKVYVTDFASLPENLQETLPEGEQVTAIQHIKYPQPVAGVPTTTDYLAISSYSAGRYKVWLHTISSTGTIQPLVKPTFEGQGRVTSVNYVELGRGNRTY